MKKEDQINALREEEVFIAIRKNSRHSFLDITTTSGAFERTRQIAARLDTELSAWAKDNPVVGFAVCCIVVDDIFGK
jgi:hypothetical protein